jgi:hypothetical protein
MTILCDAETPRFHERSAEPQIARLPRDDKGKGNGSTESGCWTEVFFTRPIPFDFLLDALKWACEIPIHRRPFVRLLDGDRLPV